LWLPGCKILSAHRNFAARERKPLAHYCTKNTSPETLRTPLQEIWRFSHVMPALQTMAKLKTGFGR
jgi:hypothetical protein